MSRLLRQVPMSFFERHMSSFLIIAFLGIIAGRPLYRRPRKATDSPKAGGSNTERAPFLDQSSRTSSSGLGGSNGSTRATMRQREQPEKPGLTREGSPVSITSADV